MHRVVVYYTKNDHAAEIYDSLGCNCVSWWDVLKRRNQLSHGYSAAALRRLQRYLQHPFVPRLK